MPDRAEAIFCRYVKVNNREIATFLRQFRLRLDLLRMFLNVLVRQGLLTLQTETTSSCRFCLAVAMTTDQFLCGVRGDDGRGGKNKGKSFPQGTECRIFLKNICGYLDIGKNTLLFRGNRVSFR